MHNSNNGSTFSRRQFAGNHSAPGLIINPPSSAARPPVPLKPSEAKRHNLSRKCILNIYYNVSKGKISPKLKSLWWRKQEIRDLNKLTESQCPPGLFPVPAAHTHTLRKSARPRPLQLCPLTGWPRPVPWDPLAEPGPSGDNTPCLQEAAGTERLQIPERNSKSSWHCFLALQKPLGIVTSLMCGG